MKLPIHIDNLINKGKKEEKKLFLTVLFEYSKITAAIFSISEDKANILSYKFAPFNGEIDLAAEIIDQLLADLASEIAGVEGLSETVFGFPQEYVSEDKIKPEVLSKLKKIVKQLFLKPIGFIVISEALACYLSAQKGSQESAIFVGVFSKEIRVSLLKIGKITKEKTIARTNQICLDLETALNSFNQEILPAKIILYDNSQDLESVKQEFLQYPWESKCSFIHFPKIEVLPHIVILKAVVAAYSEKQAVLIQEDLLEVKEIQKEKEILPETVAPEKLGFSEEKPEEKKEETPLPKPKLKLPNIKINFNFLPKFRLSKKFIFLFIAFIVISGSVLLYLNTFTGTTQLRVLIDAKQISQELEFTLDPNLDEVDIESKKIPGKKITVELKGEKSKATTGTKLVGKPAQGKVVIYNKTSKEKIFGQGEILIADNKLKFSLDSETKIASSSETVEGLTFGKADGAVTAVEIGQEGNLAAETEFVFENYPKASFLARSSDKFSGGSSREISVISEDDVVSLRKDLINEFKKEAKEKLIGENTEEISIIDETIESKTINEKLSGKIGDQAEEVKLSATIKYSALGFNSLDINKLIREAAKSEISSGYTVQEGKNNQRILDKKVNKDGSVEFVSSFSATIIPEIDTEELRTRAAGAEVADFKEFLSSQKNIGGLEVIFEQKIPFFIPKRFPKEPEKIQISVVVR